MLKQLKRISLKSRERSVVNINVDKVDTVIDDMVNINGKMIKRKRISLNYKSCKVKTCSMCPFPNDGISNDISDDQVFLQLTNAGTENNDYDMLTLYHNGNFFADNEISRSLRIKIYQYIDKLKLSYFVVESLPQTITYEKLEEFKNYCPQTELQVAIGVQTTDPFLRDHAILSPFKEQDLHNAISELLKFNYKPRVFIMFGMPFVEIKEAVSIVLDDIKKLKEIYNLEEEIVICPLVSVKNTLAHLVSQKGFKIDPDIKEISDLIDLLVFHDLSPKITFNSSVYEYTEDSIKKQEYERLKSKILMFNENMLLKNNNELKYKECVYDKNDVISRINLFLNDKP